MVLMLLPSSHITSSPAFPGRRRISQREAEEERRMLSILTSFVPPVFCSPFGQHQDTICFRQLLCPDPLCEVCNRATAEVKLLLFQESPEDATPSVSPLACTATGKSIPVPLPEPTPPPISILSPDLMTLLPDFLSPLPLNDSLPPQLAPSLESKFPLDHSPPKPLAFPPLPPHHTQGADPVLQSEATLSVKTIFTFDPVLSQDIDALPNLSQAMDPTDSQTCHHASSTSSASPPSDCALTVTQSNSVSILLKPILEMSSPDSSDGLSTYVPIVRGIDPSISEFSWWKAHARNMFLPRLQHCDFQQEHVSLPLTETAATKHVVDSFPFLGLNIQALLERQIKKRMSFQVLEKKEKEEGPFLKQTWSEYQRTSSGNSLEALVDEQDTTAPQTGWNTKDTPENLYICQQLPYVKTLGGNFQQKYKQLFWGLPSLHSESLVATLPVSRSNSPLESGFIFFNGICNAPEVQIQDQESSPLSQSHPLPHTQVHPHPFSQTNLQPQIVPLAQVHSQAHLQSSLPLLPSSFPPQIKDCGVSFHRLQNEADIHISNENQYLEWHVLQKQQEGLWGLVPVLQRSQEAVCLPPPNLPLVAQSSQASVPVSIFPGHFHVSSEPQEQLELHVPKRLMPHWCFHAYRNLGSAALMEPQCKSTEISQQNCSHIHLQPFELQGHSSKDVQKIELSCTGSFHERVPTKFQLRKDKTKNLGHIFGECPLHNPSTVSEYVQVSGLRAASEAKSDEVCHSRNDSGNELLSVSRRNLDQNEMKSILRLHLSRKSWQITADRIPIRVCHSWLADNIVQPPPGSSHANTKNRNLTPLVGRVNCKITMQELSFLDPQTHQALEAHIRRFSVSQKWGLPLKVLESVKSYVLREAKTWPLPQFDFPLPATYFSREVSKPLKGSSETFQGDKLGTTNSVPSLDHHLPATLPVDKEVQGALRQSPSDADHKLTENVQTIEDGRHTLLPRIHSSIHKASQKQTILVKRHSLKLPTGQDGAGHASGNERVSFCNRVERLQGKRMVEKNSEHFSVSNMSREIFKADELRALQSQSNDILTTSELGSCSMINANMSKEETTLIIKYSPPRILIPEDPKSSDFKRKLVSELKFKLESELHSQVQDCPSDISSTSGSLVSDYSQSVSSGDLAAPQGLRVHLDNGGIIMGQRQEPWVPKCVLQKCQDKDFPSAERTVRPPGPKAGESRCEDSRLETSKAIRKSHLVKGRKLEKTSKCLSQKEPPGSYFRKKMRELFQWFNSKRKSTGQESPLQKGKFMPGFVRSQDPVEGRGVFFSCGPLEASELMMVIGKILEEKLACRQQPEALQLSWQKEELRAQAEPCKGKPSNYGASIDPQQGEGSGTWLQELLQLRSRLYWPKLSYKF
ncbi:PREDICTED: putative spermatogenesis-associated protein 31D3 [Propithecus coquereli]|uniref:putative spermatogenesis-associated protein 31D3 n=1 Tax=Propithecus coquereli TaxID=379532 RepID=UPI00063EDF5E|nr:PREDICTED: putative spermatogenesis-associated protein 31D3 [Propithecus coquereli]